MEKVLGEMVEVLNSQTEVYEEIRDLAQKKQEKLLEGDIPDLEKVVRAEEMLIMRAGRLEERRLVLAQAVAEALGLSEVTLDEVCETVGEPISGLLRRVGRDLYGVLDEISRVNALNQEIIEASLAYVNFSLDLLMGRDGPSRSYSPKGSRQATTRPPVLDKRL